MATGKENAALDLAQRPRPELLPCGPSLIRKRIASIFYRANSILPPAGCSLKEHEMASGVQGRLKEDTELALSLLLSLLLAQSPATPTSKAPSGQAQSRIADSIRKEIVTLPTYGVFDWITFSLDGYNVVLNGFASRPTLKTSAERVAKNVEGVSVVDNRIETLPLLPNDDRVERKHTFESMATRT